MRGHKKSWNISNIIPSFTRLRKKIPLTKIFSILGILGIVSVFAFWAYFLRGVPSLTGLETGNFFRESTVIYDNDGNEIYNFSKEGKRTYIGYNDISQSIKDAIISTEDRTFFENPGIDIKGLIRVTATYITGNYGRVGGASTISQQLIKNTLLTNERSVKRKVQEAYLSYKLNREYSKEKILEMYLNAIPFGYNANGIEQASRTFFGKSAKDVGPLGATILASLPNGPTKFSPYIYRERLMGKVEVYGTSDEKTIIPLNSIENKKQYAPLYGEFKSYLSGMTLERESGGLTVCNVNQKYIKNELFSVDRNGCVELGFNDIIQFFGNINISKDIQVGESTDTYVLEYTIGRKDFVATQMLEDGKIDGPTFQKILYDGLDFEFKKYSESIKYPYFVMYIQKYLEDKYGKDIDITSGLKVYTTIDPKLQDKAEELVKKQVAINKAQHGAKSAALVSMDNSDGKLLAMVGGPDYFDTENKGNNNMATATSIRPGSSFKPFVYALAISKNPIGPETPVADIETEFADWSPDNYDGQFKGVMMVKNALAYSRNIPAVKMYYLAGQQDEIVEMLRKFGVTGLKVEKDHIYGGSLALGAGEVQPIELMQAYSVFANNGIKKKVYAVKKIEDNEGNILEEYKAPESDDQVFSAAASYIVSKMLSDPNNRPESSYWRNMLTVTGHPAAAKTGTADMKTKNGTKLPRDTWTAGYTPQITTVVWAGNVDGKALGGKCDGLNCAGPIWKGFMEFAHKDLPKEDFKKPKDIYTYNIVKSSGRLAGKNTPESQIVTTIMAVKLDQYDEGQKELQIDTLCNGPISENTPPDAIKTIYIPSSKPIIDGYDPVWTSGFFEAIRQGGTLTGELQDSSLTLSEKPCERPSEKGNISLSINPLPDNTNSDKNITIEVGFIGDRFIQTLRLYKNTELIKEVQFGTGTKKTGKEKMDIDTISPDDTIQAEVLDIFGFKYSESRNIILSEGVGDGGGGIDTPPNQVIEPSISLTNPRGGNLNLYEGDVFNLRFKVNVGTANREIQIDIDGKNIQNATSGEIFVIPVSSIGLLPGVHKVTITLIDGNFKKVTKSFNLTILPK